ncbi:MAG: hypothetical protein M0Q87_10445, partial [Ottowia sp.]|nr:hypothetical protein [Ottowia sp.]
LALWTCAQLACGNLHTCPQGATATKKLDHAQWWASTQNDEGPCPCRIIAVENSALVLLTLQRLLALPRLAWHVHRSTLERIQLLNLDSLSDFGPIYCAGGRSGPFLPAFSLHSWAMRLKIKQNCPRFPTRLASPLFENATIAKARQTPV